MKIKTRKKIRRLAEALEKKTAELQTKSVQTKPLSAQLEALAKRSSKYYIGSISGIGHYPSGARYVEFHWGNSGYNSPWPDWAYEMARVAFAEGREVSLFAKGAPSGRNLMAVFVSKRPAKK